MLIFYEVKYEYDYKEFIQEANNCNNVSIKNVYYIPISLSFIGPFDLEFIQDLSSNLLMYELIEIFIGVDIFFY